VALFLLSSHAVSVSSSEHQVDIVETPLQHHDGILAVSYPQGLPRHFCGQAHELLEVLQHETKVPKWQNHDPSASTSGRADRCPDNQLRSGSTQSGRAPLNIGRSGCGKTTNSESCLQPPAPQLQLSLSTCGGVLSSPSSSPSPYRHTTNGGTPSALVRLSLLV
jgi:hypothetical protein